MKIEVINLYEQREDVTLTTYLLADSEELLQGARRPAVLICPGGAYLSCSDREAEPAAVLLGYMLSDYIYLQETAEESIVSKGLFDISNLAYLGTGEVTKERLLEVSPARNVSKDTPPVFLWATAGDELVSVQHTIRMANALADHKIPFEVHIFEEGPHGLSLADQASAGAKSQMDQDAKKWIVFAERWLSKRFSLQLPEFTELEQQMQSQG